MESSVLDTNIVYLQGVGPKRALVLNKELGIYTYYDLLYYFPYRHIDKSTVHRICELRGELPYIQLRGRFISFTPHGEGARRRLHALFTDGTGTIECVWFNKVRTITQSLQEGTQYMIFGKPKLFGNHYSIVHPEVDKYNPENTTQGLVGVYSLTEKAQSKGITSRVLQRLAATILRLPNIVNLPDILPAHLVSRLNLMPMSRALAQMHLPQSISSLQQAQRRLKYEELLLLQLHIIRDLKGLTAKVPGFVFETVGQYFNDFYHRVLPFHLTSAQKRVIKEIRADVASGRQMNRLLQGDVGSGKTIVAFMTALLAIDNGFQACIMAPTEILAAQHYESISALAEPIGLNVGLLTGSTRKRERDSLHAALLSGELHLLVGTHALLEEAVQFANLGMAIIDEQHRFGVAQRAKLWGKNTTPPHVLVMTATPIPRTLAMTVYGDLDVSIIDELPPGRKPINTVLRYDKNRQEVYRFIGRELKAGRQAYIVYPLIEENEKLELKALEEGYDYIREIFPSYKVGYVHGRMRPAEKDQQMELFASNQTQILVATTVIEVGVNVANASVMMVENAERFGLSQLHQLRGRVGRGADQSYCILMTKYELGAETRQRLQIMTETNDGFRLAEEDMRLRGPGDLQGTQQSGIAFNLKIANLSTDGVILEQARADALQILNQDPSLSQPEHQSMSQQLNMIYNRKTNWGLIS